MKLSKKRGPSQTTYFKPRLITESADAEDVMALLRDYHAAIGEIIIKYNGTLERYAGDGVMVVFNDSVEKHFAPVGLSHGPRLTLGRPLVRRNIGGCQTPVRPRTEF